MQNKNFPDTQGSWNKFRLIIFIWHGGTDESFAAPARDVCILQ